MFSAGWLESHHGQFCDIFSLFPCPHTDLVRPDRTILCILNRLWAARINSPTPNSAANTSKFQPVFYLRPKYWQQNALRCWLCPVHDLLGESHHMPKRTGITRGIASGKCPFSSLYARWSVKKEVKCGNYRTPLVLPRQGHVQKRKWGRMQQHSPPFRALYFSRAKPE